MNHRSRSASRHRGFTLLELLVVIAIFAIFSLLAYGGLDSVLKTRASLEQTQQRLAQVQKAYLRLRDDFQQARTRPIRDNYGELEPALIGADNGHVELTRGGWRNPLSLQRSTLQRVDYSLEDDGLHRRIWRELDRAQDSQPLDTLLLSGASELHWRFLDADGAWQTQWPPLDFASQADSSSQKDPPLPRAVEIRIKSHDFGQLRFLFRLGVDDVDQQQSAGTTSGTSDIPAAQVPAVPTAPVSEQ